MLGFLVVFLFAVTSFSAAPVLSILPRDPEPGGSYSEGEVYPSVTVTSQFEIASVIADFGSLKIPLSKKEIGRPANLWSAATALDLTAAPSGSNHITFTATDVFTNTAQLTVDFIVDHLPILHVNALAQYSVATPMLEVSASCDDAEGGCYVQVVAGYDWERQTVLIATNSLHGLADLSAFSGRVIPLRIYAVDFRGNYSQDITRYVTVNTNPQFRLVESVPGYIDDFNESAVLYRAVENGQSLLKRKDRFTGTIATIATNANAANKLTPEGVLFTLAGADYQRLVELNRGRYTEGPTAYTEVSAMSPNGRFGVLLFETNNVRNAVLRDFLQQTNTALPANIGLWASVADNGVAVLSLDTPETSGIYELREGVLRLLEPASSVSRHYWSPMTDGTNALWLTDPRDPLGSNRPAPLWGLTAQGIIQLRANYYGPNYLINSGWIAFYDDSVPQQVWTRSPDGKEAQATFFPQPPPSPNGVDILQACALQALRPDGAVFVTVDDRLYLARAGEVPKPFGRYISGGGYGFLSIGSSLYQVAAGTVFRIDSSATVMTTPLLNKEGTQFSFYITSTDSGDFTLERTSDLKAWVEIATERLTNDVPRKIEVPVAPTPLEPLTAYRVRKTGSQ